MKLEATAITERSAERRRRSGGRVARLGAIGFGSLYVVSIGLLVAGGGAPLLGMIATFGAAAAASSGLAALAGAWRLFTAAMAEPEPLGPGSAQVGERSLVVTSPRGGSWEIRRGDLEAGWLEDGARAVVRTTDGTEICFETAREEDASALLRELGLVAEERVASFPIGSAVSGTPAELPARTTTVLTALFAVFATICAVFFNATLFLGPSAPSAPALPAAVLALATTALVAAALVLVKRGADALGPRRAVVGTDGIAVEGASRRFVPASAIERAVATPRGVELSLSLGERVLLPAARGGEGLARRIDEVLGARGRSKGAFARAASLERGQSSIEAWQKRIAASVARDEGYREARLDARDLAEVVADGAAPVERRIGAALALVAAGDDAARRRVRVAARASTDSELRAALEEAAEGEVEEARLSRLAARQG